MKRSIMLLFCVFFHLMSSASEEGGGSKKNPYTYCNVFLVGSCLGVFYEDRISAKFVFDYAIYTINSPDLGVIEIYSGGHPEILSGQKKNFVNCLDRNGFSSCKYRTLDDGRLEYIFTNSHSYVTHLVISSPKNGKFLDSFLANIRPCVRNYNSIECKED